MDAADVEYVRPRLGVHASLERYGGRTNPEEEAR
jgi:hypothetical protein